MPRTRKKSLRQQRAMDRLRKRTQTEVDSHNDQEIPVESEGPYLHSIDSRTRSLKTPPQTLPQPKDLFQGSNTKHKMVDSGSAEIPMGNVNPHPKAPEPLASTVSTKDHTHHQDIFHGLNPSSVLAGYIEIQVLDYYSSLLRTQCALIHGMVPPSILYQQLLSNESIHTEQLVPDDSDAVQIHFVNDHYLVSAKKNGTITVYDSLNNSGRIQSLNPQLRRMYGDLSKFSVKYVVAQSQGTSDDCGAFAAANAYFIVKDQSPCDLILDQNALRNHLKHSLQSGMITDFPSEKRNVRKDLLKRYFKDQAERKSKRTFQLLHSCENHNAYHEQIVKNKHTEKQRKWRLEQIQQDSDQARYICAKEQGCVREKCTNKALAEARLKKSQAKMRQRQKHREQNLEEARLKESQVKIRQRKKHREQNLEEARLKESQVKIRQRKKHREQNLEEARLKESQVKISQRKKQREQNLEEARLSRSTEQKKVRQKQREQNLEEARLKESQMKISQRKKHREQNLEEARLKESQVKISQRKKQREQNLEEARLSRSTEQKKVRQKHREQNLEEARLKESQMKISQRKKHREQNLEEARLSRSTEQKKVRQKQREQNLEEARLSRSTEQKKVRQKQREQNLEEARLSRSTEQKKVRKKHREQNLEEARLSRSTEQKKVRQKHKELNLVEARLKRSKEQAKARRKLLNSFPEMAKKKRAKEQQNYRKKDYDMQKASVRFIENINQYPEYVCTCCSRMLYKRSVACIDNVSFKKASSNLMAQCLTGSKTAEDKIWLCRTCLDYIRQNKMPPQSNANNLELPSTPQQLTDLSTLEERLLSQRYPFMKLLALPKGRQNAIKGAVVNIPVEVSTVSEILPRTPSDAGVIPLKLKRKVEYKGHYSFQYIRPERIRSALEWLMKNNVLYSNIQRNDTWEKDCMDEDVDTWNELTGNTNKDETVDGTLVEDELLNEVEEDNTSDSDMEEITPISDDTSHNIQFETCVQTTDLSLDASRIVSIAPGEGKRPLAILGDENFEELCFPTLFPTGKFGYKYERPVRLSVKKYFQRRILEKGSLFASNIEYLFVAQFLTEWHQILSCMSIALRKSKNNQAGEKFNAGFFKNKDLIRPLLTQDDAYRFLQPIRGSPPYWQKVMYELLAAVKQFKIFTWFLTLSAADMRWEDTLKALAKQQGKTLSDEEILEMTWEERCTLLRSNPTTAARHFHHRVQCLFTDVILSPACPLGKITKYFYRIEFQQRGSPHAHAILWVENAPHPNNSSKDICTFVDSFIQANLPKDDVPLLNLVKDVQTHRHTATCTKKGTVCRFSFPKPVSDRIILSRPDDEENEKEKRHASIEVLTKVKEMLLQEDDCENDTLSVSALLQKCNISSNVYYEALQNATKTPTIFMKREPCETCINNYNPDILRLWKVNTDLQFVTSPYAAIAYITSYITKDEREVGTVLHAVSKETKNLQVNEQMKKVAFAFSNARNVSAQEAAYRILGLPLHVSNFTTVWIPSGFPENRIRILKSKDKLNALEDDDEDIYSTNIIDRYSCRPPDMKDMCLAEFAMWYGIQHKYKDKDKDVDMNCNLQVSEGQSSSPTKIQSDLSTRLHAPGSSPDVQLPSEGLCYEPNVDSFSRSVQQPSKCNSFGHCQNQNNISVNSTCPISCHSTDSSSDGNINDTDDWQNTSKNDMLSNPSKQSSKESHLEQELDKSDTFLAEEQIITNSDEQQYPKTIVLKGLGIMKKRSSPAVIRYHQCSKLKDPELYCYNRMLLFMPWSAEKEDLLADFETYSEHYDTQKKDIEERYRKIMGNEELVEEAISQFQEFGPPRHAWDDIAPETEHTEADLIEEGYGLDNNFAILDPDTNENARFSQVNQPIGSIPVSVLETNPDLLNETEYHNLVQSLNLQQRTAFQFILSWTANVTEPQHIFITGGAGTGKSHLISAIYNMVNRELRKPGEDPTKPKILLMAPTGTAAFNIGGLTAHAALQLPTKLDETYIKLSDSTCNRLRVQLSHLIIIIIDEISMISEVAFNYIDKRLQQIKDSTLPFGGVSVLAVGDLYQLRPIGKYVFELPSNIMLKLAGSVWKNLFHIFELNQIMRQKDDALFASLLNRVREGKQTKEDVKILQARNIQPSDNLYKRQALHIFATNVQADIHNSERLRELGEPIVVLTRGEKRPSSLKNYNVSERTSETGGISKTLELSKGARVMIIRNIDVQDGLVNGAQGTIVDFLPNSTSVYAVLVRFDKPNIGNTARVSSALNLSKYSNDIVPIKRVDVSFSTSSSRSSLQITWTQFPLKLSFACTIHKVQGLSVDELVVSFDKRFGGGQAYVALSRCRSLEGLQVLKFDPKKITQSVAVQKEMVRLQLAMPLATPYSTLQNPVTCNTFNIALLNARSLRLHFSDVAADPICHLSDVLMFTEAHIYANQADRHTIPGYSSVLAIQDPTNNHHGLACYFKDRIQCQQIELPAVENIETLGVQLQISVSLAMDLILIYRSPSVSYMQLLSDLEIILKGINNAQKTVLLGDFNVDALGSNYNQLRSLMENYGFKLIQPKKSHTQGSCLDHFYLPTDLQNRYCSNTYLPTYFSDHYYVVTSLEMIE